MHSRVALSWSGLGQIADGSKWFSPCRSNLPPQVVSAHFNTILALCLFLSLWAITSDQVVCLA